MKTYKKLGILTLQIVRLGVVTVGLIYLLTR